MISIYLLPDRPLRERNLSGKVLLFFVKKDAVPTNLFDLSLLLQFSCTYEGYRLEVCIDELGKIYTHSILMHVTSIYGVEVNIMSCNVLFSI